MAEMNADNAEVNARILYWGIEGAGKTANLRWVYDKLRADHRGELASIATPLDPTKSYEILPIELGEISGLRVCIQLVAVPGAAEQAPTRKQLLDRVDGVVLVVDSRPECLDANLAAFEELRRELGSYGRSLADIPVVVQYNKRDLSDAYTLEELHRKLDLPDTAAFEANAIEGMGVLQTLTTISKRVVRYLRDHGAEIAPPMPAAVGEPESTALAAGSPSPDEPGFAAEVVEPTILLDPLPELEPSEEFDEPLLDLPPIEAEPALFDEAPRPDEDAEAAAATAEAEAAFADSWQETLVARDSENGPPQAQPLVIESIGEATQVGDADVRLPVVLRDGEGRRFSFALTVHLDLMPEEDGS